MILVFKFIPALVLLLGGLLFTKFPEVIWHQPLYLFFRKQIREINVLTGRYWLVGAVIFTVLALVAVIIWLTAHREILTLLELVVLYLIYVVIVNIMIYFQIKKVLK